MAVRSTRKHPPREPYIAGSTVGDIGEGSTAAAERKL